MANDEIDKKYRVPISEIGCPGCGLKYGHHRTKVDTISEECSKCAKDSGYKKVELVTAKHFIEVILGYLPFC